MCGIAGLFAFAQSANRISEEELERISAWQRNRGPDDHGTWRSADGRYLCDHRRLAIIDPTPAGHQPMQAVDYGLCITFNGEIYNHADLRRELQEAGHSFVSGTDTEVLLKLYAVHGADMLHRLRGMYAFAIWDEKKGGLFLARDPLGIKPLYYSVADGVFRFASLAKALLAGGKVGRAVDPAARAGFLLWGSVPEPLTWWSGIAALAAGHWLWVDGQGVGTPQRHFDVAAAFADGARSGRTPDLAEVLRQSVADHMVADVPVGIFLSSGLDSIAIASLAAAGAQSRLRSVTIGFQEFGKSGKDETGLAAAVAGHLGLVHRTIVFGREDFRRHRTAILAAMDQPTIDGINTYFVSLAAREAGLKVALSGVGGDEMLGGYPSFTQVPALVRSLRPIASKTVGRGLRRGLAPLLVRFSPKLAGVLEYGTTLADAYFLRRALFMPWELGGMIGRDAAVHALAEFERRLPQPPGPALAPHATVACLELTRYMRNQLLRDTDWSSMHHGVEVRVPFADAAAVRKLAPGINSARPPRKADLAALIDKRIWSLIDSREKRGFEIPIGEWLGAIGSRHAKLRGWRGWAMDVMNEFDAA